MKIKLVAVVLFLLLHASTSFSLAVPQPDPMQPAIGQGSLCLCTACTATARPGGATNGAYWPDLIRTDPRFAYSDVDVAEYPTPESKRQDVQRPARRHPSIPASSRTTSGSIARSSSSPTVWGGILVEEMLLRHPAEAARVKFIVSYGTPHEGSSLARIASIYDKDPLLNDLSDASDNNFLTQLEDNWRGHDLRQRASIASAPTKAWTRCRKTASAAISRPMRVWSATSARPMAAMSPPPPQEIHADHVSMVRPLDPQIQRL